MDNVIRDCIQLLEDNYIEYTLENLVWNAPNGQLIPYQELVFWEFEPEDQEADVIQHKVSFWERHYKYQALGFYGRDESVTTSVCLDKVKAPKYLVVDKLKSVLKNRT